MTAEEASQSGFMFRKGNETLVEAVNKALKDMIEDGTYEKISEKWFGENVLEVIFLSTLKKWIAP